MIIPDLNLLLYAHNRAAAEHEAAASWWRALLTGNERIGLVMPVLLGFLRVSTRAPVPRPLTLAQAGEVVHSWRARPRVEVLPTEPRHFDRALELLGAAGSAGNLVTDAVIAAIALDYGAEVHSNDADFSRFAGLRWRNPLVPTPRRRR